VVKRHRQLIVFVLLLLAAAVFTKSAPPRPSPTPAGAFSFAALGDAPYYWWEDLRFRILLRELDATSLDFTIHIGDIFWRPCSDAMYFKVKQRFDHLHSPVIYTPGDNEWTDCWEPRVGGYVPLDRLARIRQIFFSGAPRIPVARQNGFPEHARWTHGGFVFATVNLPGSKNAMKPFPARTAEDDAAARRRTDAATVWLHETFAEAARTNARGVVIAFHGWPPFTGIYNDAAFRQAYEPFMGALEDEARRYRKPVLVIHGDEHKYRTDHPLRDVGNLTRLEVPGSPDVGWVRVFVTPDRAQPFAFEEHIVPEWKYW
jgi:hypothetical protein